jgi:hypothetical protein
MSTDGTYVTITQTYFIVNTTAIYVQSTDPGPVGAGSIWLNTTP